VLCPSQSKFQAVADLLSAPVTAVQMFEGSSTLLWHCPRLYLDAVDKESCFDDSYQHCFDVLLASLSRAWQLNPSLLTHSSTSSTNGDGWMLKLIFFRCTRTALAGLPQGLTHLELG
jgi:hypothetical protein